ncbi:hypothetical protein EMIT091MI3_110161 [Kosakonia quasisacchari]
MMKQKAAFTLRISLAGEGAAGHYT